MRQIPQNQPWQLLSLFLLLLLLTKLPNARLGGDI
jgi:hypothetical protein